MEGSMRKVSKILLVVVILFAVLATAGFLVVRSQFPPEKIAALIQEQATAALERETTVKSAGFSIIPLGVKIEGLTVANHKGPGFSEKPLLDLPEMVISIDILKLFTGQLSIAEVSFTGLALNYEINEDGSTSIDGLGGAPDTTVQEEQPLDFSSLELPVFFQLNSFSLKDARIDFNDRAAGTVLTLGKINQNVDLSLDRTLENIRTTGKLLVNELSFADGKSGIRTGDVSIHLNHDLAVNLRSQEVSLNQIEAGFQDAAITLKGSVKDFLQKTPVLDLNVESNELKLASLFAEIPAAVHPEVPKIKAGGSMLFTVDVKGKVDPEALPKINGKLSLQDLALSHADVPAGVSGLKGELLFTEQTVQIKPLTLALGGNPVHLVLDASGLPKKPVINEFKVNAKVDLGKAFQLAEKVASLPEGFSLAGMFETAVQASGAVDPAKPQNIAVSGYASLQNVNATLPEVKDPVKMSGKTDFSNTAITSNLAVQVGKSDVAVAVAVKDFLAFLAPEMSSAHTTLVDVDVKSSNLILDELMPPGNGEEPEENTEPTVLPEVPENIDVRVRVALGNTVFRHLAMTNFLMNVGISNQIMTQSLSGNIYSGSISQSMTANLKDRRNAIVAMKMNLQGVQANELISNGNNNFQGETGLEKHLRDLDNSIYGKMNLDMNIETNGVPETFVSNLDGLIALQLRDGKVMGSSMGNAIGGSVNSFDILGKKPLSGQVPDLKNLTFSGMDAKLKVKDGNVTVEDFELGNTPLGMMSFTGGVGPDAGLKLAVKNILPDGISQKLASITGGVHKAAAGALAGTAAGSLAKGVTGASLYPKTDQGNAIFYYDIGGKLGSPSVSLNASRMKSEAGDGASEGVKANLAAKADELKDAAKAKADEVRLKAEQELAAQKARALKAAEEQKAKAAAKLEAEKARAQKAVAEQKQKAKDKAGAEKQKAVEKGKNELRKNIGNKLPF